MMKESQNLILMLFLVLCLHLLSSTLIAEEHEIDPQVFLKTYCYKCHGQETQKGDHRFDTLSTDRIDAKNMGTWQGILDVLHLGEMPPKKDGTKQPTVNEVRGIVGHLEKELAAAYEAADSTGGQTVYRRLNRFEYRNTIRDLLGIKTAYIDPTESFLPDEEEEGLDNIGRTLVTSDYFLQQAMLAAEKMIQRATHFEERPRNVLRSIDAPIMHRRGGSISMASRSINPYDELFEQSGRNAQAGYIAIGELPDGVKVSGRYRVRVTASSNNQRHPWGEIIKTDQDQPLRLGVVIYDAAKGDAHRYHSSEQSLGEYAMPESGEKRTVELEMWLQQGWAPRFSWANAPFRAYRNGERLLQRYHPKLYQRRPDRTAGSRAKIEYIQTMARNLLANNKGPTLRIHHLEIEGPLFDQWPPKGHQLMFGTGEVRTEDIEQHLVRFATQAFRRTVSVEEMKPYAELVRRYLAQDRTTVEALQIGFKAILSSTPFLHLPEFNQRLSDYEFANRLSYFLWSSMPDEMLFDLAAQGKLRQPDVLREQVERMLANPKSAAFVEHFTDRWLRLDKIGSMPPDEKRYREYYSEDLDVAMKQETHRFFGYILEHNLDIATFIDSDFTFANRGLAKLYGMPPLGDAELVKVAITDRRRGGLLGQASVLTATANGIDTSPVIRGVWVLENLLGTPPSPPPPDVEPLAPDLRGATTIREQLAKHREIASCNDCHAKIDPMGFALENFGPIGEWRDTYYRQPNPIDASAQFPDGSSYQEITEFKTELMKHQNLVARNLAKKLLEYGTGRIMEVTDRGTVDKITESISAKGNGLRDLVHAVVQSEIFRTK
ncbi:MAG: hypothetical protein COA78_19005 [Blastopirellula sp.]|nr:MAG: hypothetical protein COA78_19005 [Blastopirellula sp.]